jgi:hypothetical protein
VLEARPRAGEQVDRFVEELLTGTAALEEPERAEQEASEVSPQTVKT